MDFKRFYKNAKRRSVESLPGIWALGDKNLQTVLKDILTNKEPIMAEPVFQSTYPWETGSVTMEQLKGNLLNKKIVSALSKAKDDYDFPLERKPYAHQLKSWEALINGKKSIVVTSGTGSGKTECFMIPVLNDLFENGSNEGIGALFLYPLNALIKSQQKRMKAWTEQLNGKLKFALFNGNTEENENVANCKKANPELIDRINIRKTPPQIMFTNPTMLEYMLVRDKDIPILEKSQGTLRWVILDEAHTYMGSQAAEMALLLRRTLIAFGVKIEDVRFVATSATIGTKNAEAGLKKFLADLSGKSENDIAIINGKRVLPDNLLLPEINCTNFNSLKAMSTDELKKCNQIHFFREKINNSDVLSLSEIGNEFGADNENDKLELINLLSKIDSENSKAIVPLRAHFFERTISGLYSCTNLDCKNSNATNIEFSTLSTKMSPVCNKCGFVMLEVVSCSSCGTIFLNGEKNENDKVKLKSIAKEDSFVFDDSTDDDIENDEESDNYCTEDIFLIYKKSLSNPEGKEGLFEIGLLKDGEINYNDSSFYEITENKCPICNQKLKYVKHFRANSQLLTQILMPILLEEAPPMKNSDEKNWDGRKVITFTDNRQRTARSAALLNAEVERNWIRTQVYHLLLSKTKNNNFDSDTKNKLEALKNIPNPDNTILDMITELEKEGNKPVEIKWAEMESQLAGKPGITKIFLSEVKYKYSGLLKTEMARAMLFDQFAKRPRRFNSPETLGLVKLCYPELEKRTVPEIAKELCITKDEWLSLLKIAIDFFIRERTHIKIDEKIKNIIFLDLHDTSVYSSKNTTKGEKRWPVFRENNKRQQRLPLLICAGLGWDSLELINSEKVDSINEILDELWKGIRQLLFKNRSADEGGRFVLEDEAVFRLYKNAAICPVTQKCLDVTFKGYSPWITGVIEKENFNRFKIEKEILIDTFPYPFGEDYGDKIDKNILKEWIKNNMTDLKSEGLWSSLYERILLNYPIFKAGEHSAQQDTKTLDKLEKDFDKGIINVLACSTTMEMGVDIGGVAVVVMNNVPPKPSNYLQRAGRAGRRDENRSMTFTFCDSNPIGESVMKEPKWAMNHDIVMPNVSFNSGILIQRHINSFLLGSYVHEKNGMSVLSKVDSFYLTNDKKNSPYDLFISWLLKNSKSSDSINNSLIEIIKNTALHSVSTDILINRSYDTIKNTYMELTEELKRIENEKTILLNEDGCDESSPAIKALNFQENRIKNESVLKYLVTNNFLPGYGFPTGVVQFNTTNMTDINYKKDKKSREDTNYTFNGYPSRNITKALLEYAPGQQIVINGWVYQSKGIVLKNQYSEECDIKKIRSCKKCGFQEEVYFIEKNCPQCGENSFQGLLGVDKNSTELFTPVGFAVDIRDEPTRKIEMVTYNQWTNPVLLNMNKWSQTSSFICDFRKGTEHTKILHYNKGNGKGFAICLHCGRSETMPENPDYEPLNGHYRLRGGKNSSSSDNTSSKNCSGNRSPFGIKKGVVIAGAIKTDICEIRLRDNDGDFVNDETLLTSLGQSLKIHFATFLGVNEGELDFGIKKYKIEKVEFKTVFLYDTANGGIGLSSQLPNNLNRIFKIIHSKLKACTCKTACTECLLDRKSQWSFENLDRNVLIQWFDDKLSKTKDVPGQFKNNNANYEWYPLFDSLIMNLSKETPKEIVLFYKGDFKNWDLNSWNLLITLRKLNINGCQIRLLVSNPVKPDEIIWRLIKKQTATWCNIELIISDKSKYNNQYLAQITKNSGETKNWLTTEIVELPEPQENWENLKADIIVSESINIESVQTEELTFSYEHNSKIKIVEKEIKRTSPLRLSQFGNYLVEELKENFTELSDKLQNRECSIIYNDRYLNSPQGAVLLFEFIFELTKNSSKVSLELNLMNLIGNRHGVRISDNWDNNKQRSEFFKALFSKTDIDLTILEKSRKDIPHNRFFDIETDDYSITIRPDGGIDHGWRIKTVESTFPFEKKYKDQITFFKSKNKISVLKVSTYPILYVLKCEEL